jgi:RNA polymerase sigma-70 factor (ECF subfamily)
MTARPPHGADPPLAELQSKDARLRQDAFSALFRLYRSPVYRLCSNLTGNRAHAEDAVQDVFLAVQQGLKTFRGESKLSTWIFRIALRIGMQEKARAGRVASSLDEASEVPSAHAGPEQVAATQQRYRHLLIALEKLSVEQRAVLALFAVDGLGHAQIADVLNIPEGTVWSRLHVARRRLQELLPREPG